MDFMNLWCHRAELRHNNHENPYLQASWNKYGEDKFDYYIIENCDENHLLEREQNYIDTMKPEYNINLENNSYILTVKDIINGNYTKYRYSDFDYLFNKQELFEKPIYIMITLTNVYYLVIGIYLIIQQEFI